MLHRKYHFVLLILLSAFYIISCQNDTQKATNNNTKEVTDDGVAEIEFDAEHFDFGNIIAGEKVSHSYKFTNTGTVPLIIQSAHASCGCTVPEYSKEPIQPGNNGMVEVVFDSHGRTGYQYKEVVLTTNSSKKKISLTFVANIKNK